jgi:hypothetical protein
MEQVYFIRESDGKDGLECVYQYGNYTYFGPIEMGLPSHSGQLGECLETVQRLQATIPFYEHTADIEPSSKVGRCLAALSGAMGFMGEELLDVTSDLAELASTESWLDSDDSSLYFEFEMRNSFDMEVRSVCSRARFRGRNSTCTGSQGARVVFAKAYRADVMITAIFFSGRAFVTLSEAGKSEQDLVDTLFPQVRELGMLLLAARDLKLVCRSLDGVGGCTCGRMITRSLREWVFGRPVTVKRLQPRQWQRRRPMTNRSTSLRRSTSQGRGTCRSTQ